jgi:long-chain acyl-CoA synthetase
MSMCKQSVVAIYADNGQAWLEVERLCRQRQAVCVPLPLFFTEAQLRSAMESACVTELYTDQPDLALWQDFGFKLMDSHTALSLLQRVCESVALPEGIAKITFTSGSTGQPKGVCLTQLAMDAAAQSIASILKKLDVRKHLCSLPLPVLLENVAGIDAAEAAGIHCVVPTLERVGFSGSSQWNATVFLQCVQDEKIESAILLPQMLKALLPHVHKFDVSTLKLLAVGGARVSSALITNARAVGLPVYEGYGLSECSSVVCFNQPGADKAGTVGKPLPHVHVRISAEGELEVAGISVYCGYLGDALSKTEWFSTGDLASIDAEGFVTITGRKKNIIVSGFGRNISPEWVESELLAQHGIVQAAVFGEGKSLLSAVLVAPFLDEGALHGAVNNANKSLPDYAQVKNIIRAQQAFSVDNGMATGNGRNQRNAIATNYRSVLL